MLSTDLSDHLVRKGVPFREAHHVAGAVVKEGEVRGCSLDKLTVRVMLCASELCFTRWCCFTERGRYAGRAYSRMCCMATLVCVCV